MRRAEAAGWAGLLARAALAAVFLATGLGKLLDLGGFAAVLGEYRLFPAAMLLPLATLVTLAELGIGLGLLFAATRRPAAAGAALLAAGNAAVLWLTWMRGIRLENCGCFGVFFARPLTAFTPLEDVALLVLALVVLRQGEWVRDGRRPLIPALLAGLVLVAAPAAAQDFPAALDVQGRRLVLNGTGARLWSPLGIEVYRAALYLEAPSADADAILAAGGPRLVVARYRRAVPLDAVTAAWEESFAAGCGCPVPEAFRAWLRPIAAGAEERYLFLAEASLLDGSGRPSLRLPGAAPARILLGAWIGPAAPTPALRRGLLGQDR